MTNRTVIKNALVFDGSGEYPFYKDVAINVGKIVAIETEIIAGKDDEVVDAAGQWLMPGLIDIHTHLDLEVEMNPGLGEAVRHGTTSVIVGNCSLGTCFGKQEGAGENANPIVDCFARVESMPKDVLQRCVDKVTWDNPGDYLNHFKDIPLGPNVAVFLPHSMLRIECMGLAASASRKATDEELDDMRQIVTTAMDQGYIGLSIDSFPFHYLSIAPNTERRIPTQLADRKEIFSLVEILRDKGRVLQMTPDSDNPINFVKRLFWSSGRIYKKPLKISALTALDFQAIPIFYKIILNLARTINSKIFQGALHFQALPTSFRVWSNGYESPVFEELPSTRALLAFELDDRKGRRKLMDDPAWEALYRKDMKRIMPSSRSTFELVRPATFNLKPHSMNVEAAPVKAWSGDTVADILERLTLYRVTNKAQGAKNVEDAAAFDNVPIGSESLVDFFLHCLKQYDLDFRWWTDVANTRPEIVSKILFDKVTLPGFNDSGAHIGSLAFYDGNLLTLKVAQARCLKTVAKAIKRLTAEPADVFGLAAGRLEVGAQADLVLVNPENLKRYDTNWNREYIYVEHFGEKCMVNRSDGVVEQVYINGERVWEEGRQFTDVLGKKTLGRVLRFGENLAQQVSEPEVNSTSALV